MSSQTKTIQTLIRTHFRGQSPLHVTESDHKALAATIQQQLEGLRYVSARRDAYYGYHQNEEQQRQYVVTLHIDLPKSRSWANFNLTLLCNEHDELVLEWYKQTARVSTVEEVVEFAWACQAIAEQQHSRQKKQEKIRDLKMLAIMAQVKALAREEQFAYFARPGRQKLELYIKLSDNEHVKLTIPFSKFQEAAPLIRDAVSKLHTLYQTGIRFRIQQKTPFSRYGGGGWITPEPPEQEE